MRDAMHTNMHRIAYISKTKIITIFSFFSTLLCFTQLFYEFNMILESFPVYTIRPTIHSVFFRFAPFNKKLSMLRP